MSFEEQQRDELDALSAIYFNEYNYQLTLLFSFPPTYPDVAPEIEILESDNLEDRDELEILDQLSDMVQENLGLAMVFTLVNQTQEWINLLKDRKKLERQEEEERKKKELEELEHKKFEGTRVTVESFIQWKLKFDSEMALKEKTNKNDLAGKLTGKEMFMTDKNLIDSDLSFVDGNEDTDVQVDESLFADMEELEDFDEEEDISS
ncbi:hypothetical protein RDWZM_009218 [Blomia tropicalis]|uniref:RWD domain-containing protein n=1 Tax=Blomia tropicalis TaxID=40697 RepID=A0A9Q0RKU8_BLOTA|nr:hypothetical protein RDWZM_009218 [Blomia tropicalis]